MADLVSKYFSSELTEAEDQAFSEMLLNSPEESLRFAQMAESAYFRYGFPEPSWAGGSPPWPKKGMSWVVWAGIATALAVAGALFYFRARRAPEPPSGPKVSVPSSSLAPAHAVRKDIPAKLGTAGAVAPARGATGLSEAPASAAAPSFSSVPKPTGPMGSAASLSTPVPLSASTGHPDLGVIVRWPSDGPAKVQVFASGGSQVALLYDGPLAKGKWVFDWNGKLTDGRMAPPGHYQIEVESGKLTMRKRIVIRAPEGQGP